MFFIEQAQAQQAAGQAAPPSPMFSMVFMIGLFVLFYFIAIRPQRKRQKEHDALVAALQKGDEVVMTSGLLGKVSQVDGDYLTLKINDNVELKFQRIAVHAVLPKGTLKSI